MTDQPAHKKRKRRSNKVCRACAGLPYRVRGYRCAKCGLVYRPEMIAFDADGRRSNMGALHSISTWKD